MTLLESKEIKQYTKMPHFQLESVSGPHFKSANIKAHKGLLIVFTCNHCPYAIAIWPRLIELAIKNKERGIETVAINPNIHPDYPEDAPEKMKEKVSEWKIPFPYLVDEDQRTAQQYNAQCTPDLYLVDNQNRLVYHGRLDDNWQNPDDVKEQDLQQAINTLIEDRPPLENQVPSMGCSIKWQ